MKASKYILPFMCLLFILPSCVLHKGKNNPNKKPAWVDQRPTQVQYYVGIGYASKIDNKNDFQQVAKKHALDDLLGEIKVSVSSHSLLSQHQQNQQFSQQFISDTRLASSATLEGFEVVDAFETKEQYWIYYRLSKADFEARRQKQLELAREQALDLLYRADKLSMQRDFVTTFKMRLQAAIVLQPFLNEGIECDYYGRRVYLLNEIYGQLQDQLLMVKLNSLQKEATAVAGRPVQTPLSVIATLQQKDSVRTEIAGLPLALKRENKVLNRTLTQTDGSASCITPPIVGSERLQQVLFMIDIEKMLEADSLQNSMRKLLLQLESPSASIMIKVSPIRIYVSGTELNLDKSMRYPMLEPVIKKYLMDKGCSFTLKPGEADYEIHIESNTKDLGVMWGNMRRANIEFSLELREINSKEEIFSERLGGYEGFQTTPEKAGLEAYKNLSQQLQNKTLPGIERKLFPAP